jgi:hypothetical protein
MRGEESEVEENGPINLTGDEEMASAKERPMEQEARIAREGK